MELRSAFTSFDFPTSWRHGKGLAASAGQCVRQLGCRRPLVLPDDLLVRLGIVEPMFASLKVSGISYGLWNPCPEDIANLVIQIVWPLCLGPSRLAVPFNG